MSSATEIALCKSGGGVDHSRSQEPRERRVGAIDAPSAAPEAVEVRLAWLPREARD